jgi:hypothetical protein
MSNVSSLHLPPGVQAVSLNEQQVEDEFRKLRTEFGVPLLQEVISSLEKLRPSSVVGVLIQDTTAQHFQMAAAGIRGIDKAVKMLRRLIEEKTP